MSGAVENDAQRARRIREAIRRRSQELREQHPFLQHQSAIGLGLLLMSAAAMAFFIYGYASGWLPAWATVVLIALACSIAHEIEHDVIHKQYFPGNRLVTDAMLFIGLVMRPATVSPWVRREMHLTHHRRSGTADDFEEILISNGERVGFRRLLMMIEPIATTWARKIPLPVRGKQLAIWCVKSYFPIGNAYWTAYYLFFGVHGAQLIASLFGSTLVLPGWLATIMPIVDFAGVVAVCPHILRTVCLYFISSSLHYYGDIEDDNVIQQTQVLNPWYLFPLQVFCFNFGGTHAIHHFYVPDPFYMRQLTAPVAYRVMRENGVRFNDVGTFFRANRYHAA
jgi:fatty acid desaturase